MLARILVVTGILFVQGDRAVAQRVGLVNKLHEAYREVQIAEELELSEEQVTKLEELNAKFRQEHAAFIREVTALTRRPMQDGKVPWEDLLPQVNALNQEIIRNTQRIVRSRSKFQRYVQLLTQKYLRESRFEEAAALHHQTMDAATRSKVREHALELDATRPQRLAEDSWQVVAEVLTAVTTPERIAELSGPVLQVSQIPRQTRDSLRAYDDLPLRLAMNTQVQLDLKASLGQCRQMALLYESVHKEAKIAQLDAAFVQKVRQLQKDGMDPAEFEVAQKQLLREVEQLNEQIKSQVQSIWDSTQRERFDQLLFQQYLRQLDVARAMQVGGLPVDRLDRFKFPNDPVQRALATKAEQAKMHLRYLDQLDRLTSGIEVFGIVMGKPITDEHIGAISLAPEDPFLRDEELRQRLTTQVRMATQIRPGATPNPRRSDRSRTGR